MSSLKDGAMLHVIVRFPWLRDVGALSRNNAVVHCRIKMQYDISDWEYAKEYDPEMLT
jgi:hypothetical protein